MKRPWIQLFTLVCAACHSVDPHDSTVIGGEIALTSRAPEKPPVAQSKVEIVRALYTKREVRIPMRDGVELFTAIYTPKDVTRPFPILLRRTPYSCRPYGADAFPETPGPNDLFTDAGYGFAIQDVRGAYMSGGEFVDVRPHDPDKRSNAEIDESTDAFDTIDWLVKNVAQCNGAVGMWGISYPGFYAAAGMIDAHPSLKAVSPQAPIADWWYDDFRHNGALFLPHAFLFLNGFGRPRPEPTTDRSSKFDAGTPDGWRFFLELGSLANVNERHYHGQVAFWNQLIEHPTYDDFWRARDLLPHLNRVAPAVLTVGGWYDAEDLYGPLAIYRATEQRNPNVSNALVMGPWVHGGWARTDGDRLGQAAFGSKTGDHFRERIEKPFFDHHLLGRAPSMLAEATMFDTGTNTWREFASWPPQDLAPVELRFAARRPGTSSGRGHLDFVRTAEVAQTRCDAGTDEFVSDPFRPVPHTASIELGMNRPYMAEDQRFASRRPDVLVYESAPLEADMTVAGPLHVRLTYTSTATDCDWIVKLVDVYPGDAKAPADVTLDPGQAMGGYEQLVRGDAMPARFREGREHAVATKPGEKTVVEFDLWDVLHTFRVGHRVQVQVQCTWFPLVARNPQVFADNPYLVDEREYRSATQRIQCDESELRIHVLKAD